MSKNLLLFPLAIAAASAGLLVAARLLPSQPAHNAISAKERAEGWQLLFDGKTMDHWIDPAKDTPPGDAWTIEDECLKANAHPHITEDLLSQDTYSDFALQWDWKIAPGGNSGVKYRIQKLVPLTKANDDPSATRFEQKVAYAIGHDSSDERRGMQPGEKAQIYVVGFEYQMIDDARHPDARRGGLYQTAALYSILAPTVAASKPIGELNHSLLIVRGMHVEHWLNGTKVVDTSLDTEGLKDNLAHRWGKDSAVYHLLVDEPVKNCHFSLQNHGDVAWFRNIKVKRL